MDQISRIGMDTSKHIFQLHGVNAAEAPVLRKKLRRTEMVTFFEKLAPTVIAIEACGGSHHWARLLNSFGHSVKMIAPQLVKPYVKRSKNDAADAEALCEAMSRPTMRFVPVKTTEQQGALMLVGVRDRLIRNRTQLANAIRGYAAEFGLTAAKGIAHLVPLLARIQADENLPALARELFAVQAEEYTQLQAQIDDLDAKLMAWHRADECSRRLAKIPGVGPIGAVLLRMKTPAPELFRSGRLFAAWIGLTPKDHSTAGKVRLGVITRAGDEGLRSVLVAGATAVIQHAQRGGRPSPWLAGLLKRKPPKLAAVALANKTARIAWKMMVTGETYTAKSALTELAGAARDQPHTGAQFNRNRAELMPELHANEQMDVIGRSTMRDSPMHAMALSIGRRICLELVSRKPSWPAFLCERQSTGRTYERKRSDPRTAKDLAREGAVHICVQKPLFAAWRAPVSSTVTHDAVCNPARSTSRLSATNASCRSISSRITWRLEMLRPTARLRGDPLHCHLTLMVLQQHEAAQLRPEMPADAPWQRRDHHLPFRRRPALAAVADHLSLQHQILHDKRLVALET